MIACGQEIKSLFGCTGIALHGCLVASSTFGPNRCHCDWLAIVIGCAMCLPATEEPFAWAWGFIDWEEWAEMFSAPDDDEDFLAEDDEGLIWESSSTEYWCVCGARLDPTLECVCVD